LISGTELRAVFAGAGVPEEDKKFIESIAREVERTQVYDDEDILLASEASDAKRKNILSVSLLGIDFKENRSAKLGFTKIPESISVQMKFSTRGEVTQILPLSYRKEEKDHTQLFE
jgi:hypothetical protein